MSKTSLPKFEDFKAPWEIDASGNPVPDDQQQIDPARLKKHLHNLLSDKDRLQVQIDTVTVERDEAKSELTQKAREGEGDADKAQRERQEAIDAARSEGAFEALKYEVALDVEGITPAQAKRLAKRLSGKSREELAEDAKGLVEDFGIGKKTDSDGDTEPIVGRPRRVKATGDPDPVGSSSLPDVTDVDKVNQLFPRR